MELLEVSSPLNNKIAAAYVNREEKVAGFFDYPNIQNQATFSNRLEELWNKNYAREELVNYLLEFHHKFNADEKTLQNINRLMDPKSVVVIGGQQAGLLTGPLYSIHKIISIIKLAKEQEQVLKIPVLPVFWVAGEDHDFAEINHAFVLNEGRIEKRTIGQKSYKKCPASLLKIDKNYAYQWIREIVGTFGETTYTNDLIKDLYSDLNESITYVDFFIKIIFRLFEGQGLIIVDSGDKGFRKICSPFMKMIIAHNDQLGKDVFDSQMTVKELGYGEPMEINEHNAHFFYIQNGERVLLENHHSQFLGKNNECTFEKKALLDIADETPELLSNNVVTRPLMQEFVFPTLAFISGPGEIAYWSVLKKAFHIFGFKVPPVIPRLMISIIDRKTDKIIKELKLDLEKIIKNGCHEEKEAWLKEQQPFPIDKAIEESLTGILNAHKPLKELALQIDPSLEDLTQKNAKILESQIYFLKQKMEKTIRSKHKVELDKFDYINHCLKPLNAPQERIWNIFYYVNMYGYQFIDEILNLDYEWNGYHKVILV